MIEKRDPGASVSLLTRAARWGGFTALELLVSIAVIAVLLSLMLPALRNGMATSRSFKCKMSLRGIAFDFSIFADSQLHGSRGTDTVRYGPNRFSLETFMESEYGVDEFWSNGDAQTALRPKSSNLDPMRCPEVKGDVVMRTNTPCRAGGVGPVQNISYGFNSRLFRAEIKDIRGRPRVREVQLTSAILRHGSVPIAWDVDGDEAASKRVLSIFSAPSLDSKGPYAGNRQWFPGNRHLAQANYALIDGSVHSERDGLARSWDWAYQPRQ